MLGGQCTILLWVLATLCCSCEKSFFNLKTTLFYFEIYILKVRSGRTRAWKGPPQERGISRGEKEDHSKAGDTERRHSSSPPYIQGLFLNSSTISLLKIVTF